MVHPGADRGLHPPELTAKENAASFELAVFFVMVGLDLTRFRGQVVK
jgi:hypothetical protein